MEKKRSRVMLCIMLLVAVFQLVYALRRKRTLPISGT